MPHTTKKLISDQVLYKLSGGVPDSAFPVDERDIWKATEQKINSLFKLKHFSVTLPAGETVPENTMIATYDNVAVTSSGNGTSYSSLPVIPISLPRGVGIFLIYDPAYPDIPFIPIQRGQKALIRMDDILSDFLGLIAYEPKNNIVVYTDDLTVFGLNAVSMELCVFDMSQYSATDVLPVPSDYEEQIVSELVAQFAPVLPESGYVNNFTTANQNNPSKQ